MRWRSSWLSVVHSGVSGVHYHIGSIGGVSGIGSVAGERDPGNDQKLKGDSLHVIFEIINYYTPACNYAQGEGAE